ncbi:hypothetical protein M885DRAFT_507332 [Pelagophyceae sp. CCMP2097]|nr:hypothetical protein M885DRAFT_507332 [Pelagophyceae sp. CCMP2097]
MAKLAFSYDVLSRMAPNGRLLFLDTDTAALDSLSRLLPTLDSTVDLVHMAEDPGSPQFANTGVYLVRRNADSLRFFSMLLTLMFYDGAEGGPGFHDQSWINFMFVHLATGVGAAPLRHKSFAWDLVGAPKGGNVDCKPAVYHAKRRARIPSAHGIATGRRARSRQTGTPIF